MACVKHLILCSVHLAGCNIHKIGRKGQQVVLTGTLETSTINIRSTEATSFSCFPPRASDSRACGQAGVEITEHASV